MLIPLYTRISVYRILTRPQVYLTNKEVVYFLEISIRIDDVFIILKKTFKHHPTFFGVKYIIGSMSISKTIFYIAKHLLISSFISGRKSNTYPLTFFTF